MQELLYQAISLLPSIVLTAIVAYFYSRKKTPGLLLMLIAYIVLFLLTACSHYAPLYIMDRSYSAVDVQKIYIIISLVSLVAQVLLAVGLGIVLSRYPNAKSDTSAFNDTTIFKP